MKEYLNKQIKLREENLKYDFLPSMIEIIEHPANKLGTMIMFLIIAMIISAIIWAAFFKIDIAVTATGSTMPEGGIITLSTVSGGRISKVYAKDGGYVKKGDIIFTIDAENAEIDVLECQHNLDILEVQREVYGMVYESLMSEKEKNAFEKIDTQRYGEYASIADAIVLENEIFLIKWNEVKDEKEKQYTKQEHILEVLQNMNTLDEKIESATLELENAKNQQEQYSITAPVDGRLTQINSVYEGLLVNAGDMVGYLMPKEKENIFTAYVPDEDIGQIELGDSVGIKIAAYNDTKDEYAEGIVVLIGDVSFNMEDMGAVYKVEISIPNLPEDVKAGMEGSCDIIIGQRSVLDYFLEPFKKGLKDSLKER